MREFTFSLRFPNGATQALVMEARDESEAREKIAKIYPGAVISWII